MAPSLARYFLSIACLSAQAAKVKDNNNKKTVSKLFYHDSFYNSSTFFGISHKILSLL